MASVTLKSEGSGTLLCRIERGLLVEHPFDKTAKVEGFRPNRRAHEAIAETHHPATADHRWTRPAVTAGNLAPLR